MKLTIEPSTVSGTITAPASKSAMQRACAAALLRKGTTILHNPGVSNDDKAAKDIIRQLGATIQESGETVIIISEGVHAKGNIFCGESGLSVRMFTPIAAISAQPIVISGTGSLLKRPLDFFDTVLPQLEVQCHSNKGYLPLEIKGPLQPRNIIIDGSLSSQFLTGILFSFSASHARDITVTVSNLNSKPYIDLTLQVMQAFGLKTPTHNNYETFYFDHHDGTPSPDPLHFQVEGDWSGGAFLLVAGAISGNIEVRGLDVFSSQADRAVLQPLMQAGAIMSIETEKIRIGPGKLQAFHFNATDCPDLFPPLVALAAYCEGTSVIEGVVRLTHKESNRALTLQEEFGKLGVSIELQDDLMVIRGGQGVQAADADAHHDHRIAMACAVAALGATGPVTITGAEAVNKSYPQFWEHLRQLQVVVTQKQSA